MTWYASSMKGMKRGLEKAELAIEGLFAINRCGVLRKFKCGTFSSC